MKFYVARPTSYFMKRFEGDLLPIHIMFLDNSSGFAWAPLMRRQTEIAGECTTTAIDLLLSWYPFFWHVMSFKVYIFTLFHQKFWSHYFGGVGYMNCQCFSCRMLLLKYLFRLFYYWLMRIPSAKIIKCAYPSYLDHAYILRDLTDLSLDENLRMWIS